MIHFCEDCEKIVPESEISDMFDTGKPFHYYISNASLGTSMPGSFGYCSLEIPIFCGLVREPTPEVYFIYETLKLKSK